MPKATAKTKHIAELIELLLTEPINPNNVKGNPVLPMDLKEPIGFAEKFSSLLYETPNIGSTSKKEFFIHGVLGSVLTLPDSGLMEKLGINKVYVKHTMRTEQGSDGKVEVVSDVVKLCFSFEKDGKKQIALRVFANDEVTGDGNPGDKYRYSDDELKEIAKKLGVSDIDVDEYVFRISTEGDSDNKSFRLHKEQTDGVKERFKAAASSQSQINNEFEEVSAQSTNLEDSFKKLSGEDVEKVIGGTEEIFKEFASTYQDNKKNLSLFNSEAAYHGFHYGALALNFKYRYGLNCYVERTAGNGRADLIFMSRTKDANGRMNPKPIPVVIEFKGEGHTADEAIAQIKNKGYLYNLSIRTKAEDAVIAGVAKGGGLKVEKDDIFQSRGFIHQILEGARRLNQNRIGRIKDILKGELKNLYHSIQSNERHYLSKLVLGQVLAANNDGLDKYIFTYANQDESVKREATTFVLFNQDEDKAVILNIIEHSGEQVTLRGQKRYDSNKIPLIDELGINSAVKIDVTISTGVEHKPDVFEVEEKDKSYYQDIKIEGISNINSKGKYQGDFQKIENVDIGDLIRGLQGSNIKESRTRGDRERSDKKLRESLSPLAEALSPSPFKGLIKKEVDFQAIMQGLFINGETKDGKEIRVYTESNLSPQGRMDLGLSFTQLSENDGSLIEDDPIIVELKRATSGSDASRQLKQAEGQIGKKYKILRSFTDKKTAKHLAMVINNAAKNENNLIVASMKTVEVYHTSLSSGSDLSPDRKRKAACLPGPSSKRPRLNKRAVDGCLLDMDEDEKVNKESTGIEVNEENFDESKIDDEKLRAYQEKIKDEGNEINDQLNKLIIEIQQAQAIKRFSDTYKVIIEELFPALKDIDGMQSENRSYFEQMCKLNLLRIISPIIKDVDFKSLLFNNPEKLVKDQSLLENVFASVESLVSDKYKQQQLQYEDFENLEDQINEEILNKSGETEGIANQDVNKTDLLNYVFESIGLSLSMDQDTEVSIDLQKRIYYETLINLGVLIHDHKNHIQITHNGDQHTPHIDSLVERVKSSKLLSIAHDLYYLRKNEGNIDQSNLCSSEVKSKISLYGSINSEYKLNDIYNKFDIDEFKSYFSENELKRFSAEFEAYNKEVITIHSTQVFTGGNGVHVKVRDKSGNVKQLIIGSIEDIKNIENYSYNEETLEIKLKVRNDKEYTITHEEEKREAKYYLNIAGYKTKVGNIINSFTDQAKNNIHHKLNQLQDKIELLAIKKDIEAMADIEVSGQDYIREVRQNLLMQGVSESTFDQFEKQLDYVNEEVFRKYVSDISEELTKNNIEFNNSKFNVAKMKGAKGNKFFSIMAIYDLLDSVKDVPTLGRHDNDALKRIFGINGILDAINDVRETISTSYMRSSGKVVTKIRPDSAMGRIFSKIPDHIRKTFVKIINNPVIQGITFATIAYQFGYSINEIVKGNHHPLNYYWTASSGIKLASMSIKPISIGVSSTMKGISATTKVLRGLSSASKVLGRISKAAAVVDVLITIGVKLHERMEYTKAIAEQVPLLPGDEQAEVFFAEVIKAFTGRDIEKEYENIIMLREQLLSIKTIANDLLNKNRNIGAVVLHVNKVEMGYSKIIKFTGSSYQDEGLAVRTQICAFEKEYSSHYKLGHGLGSNLSTLNISQTFPVTPYTLALNPVLRGFSCVLTSQIMGPIFFFASQDRGCGESLNRRAYFIDLSKKHLPYLNLDEYENDGLRVVNMPQDYKEETICSDIVNSEHYETSYGLLGTEYKCNIERVYRNCTQVFTLSDQPFIFTRLSRQTSHHLVAYLTGPNQLIAAENYPAVMHIPKGRVDYKGSEYHDNTFIINYDTYGSVRGGTANNTIVMNYSPSAIFVRLDNGIIDAAGSKIELANIHNYISHSTADQNITTGCKTRYVDAGKGGGNNFIQNYDIYCQDEDYEIRKVNKKDTHLRSIKQTIFIVDKSSGSGANISSGNLKLKENLDVIYVKSFDISQLRINEHQNGYRLNFVTDEEVKASVRIDSFEKLVTEMGTAVTIVIRDKSLPDIIKDMVRQKLSHTGADIDDKIIENSKKRSKAVIIADITGSENTTAYAVAKDIAESSDNLGITVSQIQVNKGDIVLNYAVNDLSQIKLIPNNATGISDEAQGKYENLLLTAEGNGDVNKARDSLKKGASIEAKNRVGTPLHVLTWKNGPFSVIRFLVDQGANIEAKNDYKNRPLHHAAYTSRPDVVRYFVEKGANISAKDNNNKTPLERANGNRKSEIVNFLRKKQSEYSRLFVDAVTREDFYEVKDLLNRGADVNVPGDRVGTCLQLLAAMESNKFNKLQVLIDQCVSLDIGPMGIVIIKKLRDGMLCAPSTEFTNEVCNFQEELFGKMIKKVVSDVHGGADIKKILGFIRGCNNITRNIRGYVAVFDEIMKNNPDNEAMFTLASYVREVTEMNNYHNVSSEKRSELERIKRGLPKSVKNAVFSSEVCIKNAYQNEYLYAANDAFSYDSNRRRIFTWIPGQRVRQGMWQIEVDDDSFYIRNVYHNEYLYASYNSFNYDNDRRRVFTWIPGEKDEQSLWKIEPLDNNTYIKNVKFNEYLYAANYGRYDDDRRRVFTWIQKEKVVQGVWQIEDCGTIRKRRDTLYHSERHQHLKDRKRSRRSPVYVRSIGIHGHHGITKGIEHDLFYDSVLNNSPQNDETGYNKGGATSGASKPSSWINVFANTIVGAVKGASQFISSSFKPAIDMGHSQPSKAATTQGTDVNGTLFLLDVFIRKITGQKYVSTTDQPTISLPEAVFYASDIINGFEKAVEQAASKSGMSMHRLVDIDSMEMREEITGKIMGGKFNEIPGVLISYVEKACPSREAGCPGKLSPKKFDKFMTIFNNRINITLDESILQILHSEHNKSKVKNTEEQQRNLKDKKQPRSYLDDSSVQDLLTQAVVSK